MAKRMKRITTGKLITAAAAVFIVLVVIAGYIQWKRGLREFSSTTQDVVKYNPYGAMSDAELNNLVKIIDNEEARKRAAVIDQDEAKRLENAAAPKNTQQ